MSTAPIIAEKPHPKLAWYQLVWVGWPIALVAVGGAIGGACGGAAWALNQKVFRATKNPVLRYVWTGLISVAAVLLYFVAAVMFLSIVNKAK
jgi:hypothetical protein